MRRGLKVGLLMLLAVGVALAARCGVDDSPPSSAVSDGPVDMRSGGPTADMTSASAADLAAILGACPNLGGKYTVAANGLGCGDLNANAPQCINTFANTCSAFLQSGPMGVLGAVHGTATITMDGSFTNAMLELGTSSRRACSAIWNPATSTLVISCAPGTPQECIVTLTRVAFSCK